jgi:hypothetical protein
MVMDGVFTRDGRGDVRFHAARYPATPDVTPLLVTLARRIGRLLKAAAARLSINSFNAAGEVTKLS